MTVISDKFTFHTNLILSHEGNIYFDNDIFSYVIVNELINAATQMHSCTKSTIAQTQCIQCEYTYDGLLVLK